MTVRPLTVRALLLLGVVPNALLAAVAAPSGNRALVHVEYLVLVSVAPLASRAMLTLLLAVTLLVDVAFSFAPALHFGPQELLAAVEQIRHFSGRALTFSFAFVAATVVAAALIVRLALPSARRSSGTHQAAGDSLRAPLRLSRVAAGWAAAVLMLLALDVANGTGAFAWRARTTLPFDVSTSLLTGQYARGLSRPPEYGQPMRAATDALREEIRSGVPWTGPAKIVLVLVESMSLPIGGDLGRIFGPLADAAVRARYDVRTGTIPFIGATTSAEFRELCGIRMSHAAAHGQAIPECLPGELARLGYASLAMHHYTPALFARNAWYPRIGFQRMWFADELSQMRPGMPACGIMFRGACDPAVAELLRDALRRAPAEREFIYWLTLSSHFPLDRRTPRIPAACEAIGSAGRSEEGCAFWSSVWPVFETMARIATDPSIPDAWYIIVGDHAPPRVFDATAPAASGLPSRFADDRFPLSRTEVPFLELRPRRVAALRGAESPE